MTPFCSLLYLHTTPAEEDAGKTPAGIAVILPLKIQHWSRKNDDIKEYTEARVEAEAAPNPQPPCARRPRLKAKLPLTTKGLRSSEVILEYMWRTYMNLWVRLLTTQCSLTLVSHRRSVLLVHHMYHHQVWC